MSILFKEVPANQLSPDVFVEIDPNTGNVGASTINYKVLAIGQKTVSGTANELEVIQVTSFADAVTKFGGGSHIASMAEAYFSVQNTYPLYACAIEDDGSGVGATGSIAFSGTATDSGTYAVIIGGRRVTVGVTNGDAATDVATALVAAVTADTSLPVTASAITGTVTLTAKNAGTLGNSIPITENYYTDDETPAGITTTVTAMASGATDPDIQDILDAIPETDWFQYIVGGYTTAAEITKIETYLANRFVATEAKSGVYWTALNSATGISELTSYGSTRNSTHSQVMGLYKNPSMTYDFAMSLVAAVAPLIGQRQSYNIADVGVPFVLPSLAENLFNNTEHNQLLANGISTYNKTSDGLVKIDKIITTYQTNDAGATDNHFRDIQSFYNVQYLRFDLVTLLSTVYQNFNIVDAGSRFGTTANNATTVIAIGSTIENRLISWEGSVLIENAETAIKTVVVERNDSNPNRVDFRVEVDLANQLEIIAGQIGFEV